MIPPEFDYHAPKSLSEAVALLSQHGDDAKVMSGGQSLLPMMKLRLAHPAHVVDIGRIPDLDYIREADGYLEIGGLTREATIERSELLAREYPILSDTARVIADPLVRNRATLGGNLAHGDPANDQPATMLALDAEILAYGPNGERTISIDDFFFGFYATALEPTEIIVQVRIPKPPARSGGAYTKFERKVGDYAIAAVAAQVTLADDGTIARAGIGLTNLGLAPIRAADAEASLQGQAPSEEAFAEAGRLAAAATDPVPDRRGSAEYKRNMARVLTIRTLRKAVQRAGA